MRSLFERWASVWGPKFDVLRLSYIYTENHESKIILDALYGHKLQIYKLITGALELLMIYHVLQSECLNVCQALAGPHILKALSYVRRKIVEIYLAFTEHLIAMWDDLFHSLLNMIQDCFIYKNAALNQ